MRLKDNLISIPWDSANRHTVHQTHWWGWAKFECHHSEKHPILIIQVGKGDSFRWSARLLLHLPGFTLPFTSPTVQPRRTAAITKVLSCNTGLSVCSALVWISSGLALQQSALMFKLPAMKSPRTLLERLFWVLMICTAKCQLFLTCPATFTKSWVFSHIY